MRNLSAFATGLLFGLGLCVSGMIAPSKVLGFLDLAGAWDPSLALVMGGAVVVAFAGFRFARSRRTSFSGRAFDIPAFREIDARLIGGSALFGIGWGLVGLCPGPAIVDLGFLDARAVLFVAAMAVGMALHAAIPAPSAAHADAALQDG